jgi:DNA-binding Lrp family transcriptional regulator
MYKGITLDVHKGINMLTKNESKVLGMLLMRFKEEYSINQIAKKCGLSPNGAMKIARKFENLGILKVKKIANISSYQINFENQKTKSILELALIPDLEGRVKFRMEDLRELKEVSDICIIFGSYIQEKKEPNDLDVFFVVKEKNFEKYKELSRKIYKTIPIKVQDVLQTEEDLKNNILEHDNVITEIFRKGIILWGQDKIINLIENAR